MKILMNLLDLIKADIEPNVCVMNNETMLGKRPTVNLNNQPLEWGLIH